MFEFIKSELAQFNIDLVSCLHLDECEIKRTYLLQKNGIENGSVIIFAVPYLTPTSAGERNISSYAVSKDYHYFFTSIFEKLLNNLKNAFPQYKFAAFSDHSPINEIDAAVIAGLGVKGRNNLLITEKYSSFVFIGEIITNANLPSLAKEKQYCANCGRCESSCPVKLNSSFECLSSLTQKKGDLNDNEISAIRKSGCIWGCDICQNVCPHTINAINNNTIYTNIDYFYESQTPILTYDQIHDMSDEEFSLRAYSWRGKNVILRNLKILEEEE